MTNTRSLPAPGGGRKLPRLDRAFFRLVLVERAIDATFTPTASRRLDQRLVEFETLLMSCPSGAGRR